MMNDKEMQMDALSKMGQWLEDNIIPFFIGFVLGMVIILERIS